MFTKTPKLSPIQQQVKEQLQNSYNKAQCYLEMYHNQQTKIPIMNLTQYILRSQLRLICSQLFSKYDYQHISSCFEYCFRVYERNQEIYQNDKNKRDFLIELVFSVLFIIVAFYELPTILQYLYPLESVNINYLTCRYVDYLLLGNSININSQIAVGRINWPEVISIKTLFLIIIVPIICQYLIQVASQVVMKNVTFVKQWNLIKQLKLLILDLFIRGQQQRQVQV